MKKKIIKNIAVIFFGCILAYHAVPALAQTGDYKVLTPLPGLQNDDRTTTLQKYLPAAFNLTIGIAVALAFIMITVGGVMYAVSDSLSGHQQGRQYIENAVVGLLLAIGAYTILYTINPQMLAFSLNIDKPLSQGGVPGVISGQPMSELQIAQSNLVRTELKNAGVDTYAGPCTQGQTKGCVNLNGLAYQAVQGLGTLKGKCGCSITITGGTEDGHKTHGVNQPIVDIRKDASLDAYITKNAIGKPVQTSLGPLYSVWINGRTATFLDEQVGDAHWHVVF